MARNVRRYTSQPKGPWPLLAPGFRDAVFCYLPSISLMRERWFLGTAGGTGTPTLALRLGARVAALSTNNILFGADSRALAFPNGITILAVGSYTSASGINTLVSRDSAGAVGGFELDLYNQFGGAPASVYGSHYKTGVGDTNWEAAFINGFDDPGFGNNAGAQNYATVVDKRYVVCVGTTQATQASATKDITIGLDLGFTNTAQVEFAIILPRFLGKAMMRQLSLTPYMVFGSLVEVLAQLLSADVTVNLTGIEGTGQFGTLAPAIDYTLSGVEGTGAVGTLLPIIDAILTGIQGDGAVGTLVPSIDYTLSGVEGTGQLGTITASAGSDVTVALSGIEALGQLGVLVAEVSYALAGVEGTGQLGAMVPNIDYALTGVAGTGQLGTVTASGGGAPANDKFVRSIEDNGVIERYQDNGDGTHALVLTTVLAAGKDVASRWWGIKQRFVLQGDGSHARYVVTATLGGSDVLVRHPEDKAILLRFVDIGSGLFAEKIVTSGATGSDQTVRIVEDDGVRQRYVAQGDGTWARLVLTSGSGGAVVTNLYDGMVFERWTPNGDGTNSQRVTLL